MDKTDIRNFFKPKKQKISYSEEHPGTSNSSNEVSQVCKSSPTYHNETDPEIPSSTETESLSNRSLKQD